MAGARAGLELLSAALRKLCFSPAAWRRAASIIGVLAIWQYAATHLIANQLFFVPLTAVFTRAQELWATGELPLYSPFPRTVAIGEDELTARPGRELCILVRPY
jgi:hypothetical protein